MNRNIKNIDKTVAENTEVLMILKKQDYKYLLVIKELIDSTSKCNFLHFLNEWQNIKTIFFNFLHHYKVPPDNNAPERAIRNVKIKQKIAGYFKTENGAQNFAVIRSVTDTYIKNDQNILDAFKAIAILQVE